MVEIISLLEGGIEGKAYLQYSYIKPDYVDLQHTVVPAEFQNRGIAKVLAQVNSQSLDMLVL